MKYERFEQLPVWQAAAALAARILPWAKLRVFHGMGDLTDQLQRSALSISNNIAEGFERGTTNELLTFLYYARGSAGEVRSMLCVMEQMPQFRALQRDIDQFKEQSESISRQIRSWASSLQNTDIKGTRYLNEHTKHHYENRKKRIAFQDQMTVFMQEKERELKQKAQQEQKE